MWTYPAPAARDFPSRDTANPRRYKLGRCVAAALPAPYEKSERGIMRMCGAGYTDAIAYMLRWKTRAGCGY